MPNYSTRLGLVKPLGTENIAVGDLNANADRLDAAIGATVAASSSPPSGSAAWDGRFRLDSDTGKLYVRRSGSWRPILIGDGGVQALTGSLNLTGDLTVSGALSFTPTLNTFTPTFVQGFTSEGTSPTKDGWYYQIGKMVFWGFRVQFGTSVVNNTTVVLNLPVAAYDAGLQTSVGSWIFRATSSSHYAGTLGTWAAGATSCSFSGSWNGSTKDDGRLSNTQPGGIIAASALSGGGFYRAA